jgi:hypothetical protein
MYSIANNDSQDRYTGCVCKSMPFARILTFQIDIESGYECIVDNVGIGNVDT